ncbi:MAG: hypothetical protein A2W31_13440 [Planctomycetes bacterium RBG_16_64_10]|nr:MAG: hypothetical protein A2W31_13440 [Planctomycetes bacterium RBG_16_64_10]
MTSDPRWLDQLQRRLGRFAVPNLTIALICGQVLLYVVAQGRPAVLDNARLIPQAVMAGEIWRLVTFLFEPPPINLLFALLFWYLFYLMGTALEHTWGAFRYNVFLIIGFVATVAVALLAGVPASNLFVQGSVFLAFALVFPDFVLQLFFILPIKIKWLALLAWIGYLVLFALGSWTERLLILASVGNVLLFFAKDFMARIRSGRRRRAWESRRDRPQNQPRHRCTVCGISNLTHPKMQFRYCTKCAGQCGYCAEHLFNHEHIKEPSQPASVD